MAVEELEMGDRNLAELSGRKTAKVYTVAIYRSTPVCWCAVERRVTVHKYLHCLL
jgi:hypothetical protein